MEEQTTYSKKKIIIISIICFVVLVIVIILTILQTKKTENFSPTTDLSEVSNEWKKSWDEQMKKGNEEFKNRPEQKLKDNWSGKVWGEDYLFSIVYIPSTDEFYLDVGSASCIKCRDAALDWFKKQGVDPNKLKIVWIPNKPQQSTPYNNPNE